MNYKVDLPEVKTELKKPYFVYLESFSTFLFEGITSPYLYEDFSY